MKRFFFVFLLLLLAISNFQIYAQSINTLKIQSINLPPDISYYDNQFSSLYISNGNLYLMSESRIQDNSPAFIAYVSLKELDQNLKNISYRATFHRIALKNINEIKNILERRDQSYEGLEAMAIGKNKDYYFSIETATPSDSCYVIKGILQDSSIALDTDHVFGIAKPLDAAGKHIYNAGFESMEYEKNRLLLFFEYNYFKENKVLSIDCDLESKEILSNRIAPTPFRITDITWDKKNKSLFATNYFYDGGGGDTIYRVPKTDPSYSFTVKNDKPNSYSRIIKLNKKGNAFSYEPWGELPEAYWQYNWEGIAQYKKGLFIINDKYTPKRPYKSVLLFVNL